MDTLTACINSSKYLGLSFTESFKSGRQQAREATTLGKLGIWADLQFNQQYFPTPFASPLRNLCRTTTLVHPTIPNPGNLEFVSMYQRL